MTLTDDTATSAPEPMTGAPGPVTVRSDSGHDHYGAFPAISLEQIIERASLLTRVDRKYVIPLSELDTVLGRLEGRAEVVDIDGRRDFWYESVYFDTPDLRSYWLAQRGRRRRFKIRTRTYLDSAESFVEVKTKGGRKSTVKDRMAYQPDVARLLTEDALGYVAEVFAGTGIGLIDTASLAPVLTTLYSRATLFIPSSESRATFDTHLQWQLESGRLLERPMMAIVETKSGQRASIVDRVLWSQGFRPVTMSKYGTGMAALRPELPSNKWAPVLHREFDRPRQYGTRPTPA